MAAMCKDQALALRSRWKHRASRMHGQEAFVVLAFLTALHLLKLGLLTTTIGLEAP